MNVIISPVFGILSGVWLAFFLLGQFQFNRIKARTTQMIMEKAIQFQQQEAKPTVETYFAWLQPHWESMLKNSAWFILHKTELWPMPASPDYVRNRMNFTLAWLGAYLRLHGHKWPAEPELEKKIHDILALARSQQRGKR